ncbi:MAG: tRNA (N6-threonylcarbamoyladenosine(37)-N6)-methyltransferase TrmO [Deltaproteobacteria bacterium]|nr:tRNA (N6-threonylcarbamoyladenosine(37)-N6)-methyltransferase TrmO [Candidatus Zymogenaceae bacterium]
MTSSISYRPIGVIHSPLTAPGGGPPQGVFAPDIEGNVEVFPEFSKGLTDIGGFSHLYLLYHFHLAGKAELLKKPFLDDTPRGIFAIRYFNRPNPIGLSVVRLMEISGPSENILRVSELDILDGTPLLDIKPVVPAFDYRKDVRIGWLEGKLFEDR